MLIYDPFRFDFSFFSLIKCIISLLREKSPTSCNLLVLGDVDAGKTTLIKALQGKITKKVREKEQTSFVDFEFSCKYNGEQRIIKGHDFSGSEDFIQPYYKEEIRQCDCLLYICNIDDYLNDNDKQELNNARLHLINTYLSNRSIPVQVILTYASRIRNRDEACLKFVKFIQSKKYGGRFLERQPIIVEMKDDVEMRNLTEKVKKILFNL